MCFSRAWSLCQQSVPHQAPENWCSPEKHLSHLETARYTLPTLRAPSWPCSFCSPTLYPKRRQFSWLDFLFLTTNHVRVGVLAVPKFLEPSFTHSFLLYSWRHQSYRSDMDFIRWTLRTAIFPGFREHITRISQMDNNTWFSVGKKKCPRHHCLLYPLQ